MKSMISKLMGVKPNYAICSCTTEQVVCGSPTGMSNCSPNGEYYVYYYDCNTGEVCQTDVTVYSSIKMLTGLLTEKLTT